MFPLHQSDELCFQISPNPHKKQAISSEDLFLGHDNISASLEDHIINNIIGSDANKDTNNQVIQSPSPSRKLNPEESPNNDNKTNNNNKKKMKHRDIERQRRQEMASLHASLRSLLPLQLIKGKRSMSDHINESAKYINLLQVKIKELGSKRDELKAKLSGGTSESTSSTTAAPRPTDQRRRSGRGISSDSSSAPAQGRLTLQPCCSGVEIAISTTGCFEEGNTGHLPLSRVLEVLLGEGLSVVACVSTKVNGIFLHTIQSEASDKESIDLSALEQKLKEVFFYSSNNHV